MLHLTLEAVSVGKYSLGKECGFSLYSCLSYSFKKRVSISVILPYCTFFVTYFVAHGNFVGGKLFLISRSCEPKIVPQCPVSKPRPVSIVTQTHLDSRGVSSERCLFSLFNRFPP